MYKSSLHRITQIKYPIIKFFIVKILKHEIFEKDNQMLF